MRRHRFHFLRDPFFLLAVGLLAASGGLGLSAYNRVLRCAHVAGVVVDYVGEDPRGPARARRPMALYEVGGKSYGLIVGSASAQSQFPIGASVQILYLPEAPGEAWVDDDAELYGLPVVLGAVGLISALVWITTGKFRRRHL